VPSGTLSTSSRPRKRTHESRLWHGAVDSMAPESEDSTPPLMSERIFQVALKWLILCALMVSARKNAGLWSGL
jgi:hypothetical protein